MAIANSQIRVIAENLARVAELTSAPELENVATMPIEHTQNSNRTLSYRSTAVDGEGVTIGFELPARKRISAVVIDGHNLRVGDVWRVRLWSGPEKTGSLFETEWMEALVPKTAGELNWGVDTLSATVFDDWDRAYSVAWFGSIAAQSGEIEIISNENPDGYIEINRLFFGQAISPQRNFSFGYELDYLDTSTYELTAGGSGRSDAGVIRRIVRLSLPRVLDSERSAWADFMRQSAKFNEIFVSLFPERGGKRERDYAMVCTVQSRSPLANANALRFTLSLTLQEA